ncbi:hypothetical protein ASG49_15465 [Marmoricola sp. Leaf446]|uniref:DUF3093 domain-containing protein n=1 Tax=Marmoricola sp. Leaf446 TaxID=1736379 RepID=UPI0006FE1A80|nr:DUF3093 domain-containing protein [Marmoricola sp. Leaf446]KQT89201.1 hypothetical protein ASG49_15465 [Marmoricola sp. Leaf446]
MPPTDSPAPSGASGTTYSERLHVPLRWWVQATMLLATVWLAFVVAMPPWVASALAGGLLVATYAFFAWVGSAVVAVRDGELRAGRAHVATRLLGPAEALDAEQTRRVHGVDADARAFLMTRPYLKRAVLVPVLDPADPTPYWLVSTRHPGPLAAALEGSAGAPGA